MDEIVDEPSRGRPVGIVDVDAAAERIYASDKGQDWAPDVELDLGSKRWKPNAVSKDGRRLLYVFLPDQLPRFVRDRLDLAAQMGIKPTLALNLASLFKPEIVELLVGVDADVIVLDDYDTTKQLTPRPLLAALADVEVQRDGFVRNAVYHLAQDLPLAFGELIQAVADAVQSILQGCGFVSFPCHSGKGGAASEFR